MRPCDTCRSPYLEEIDELIMAGWQNKEIYRYLKGRHPGMKVPSYDSICGHARNHVDAVIDRAVLSSRKRQRKIREEIKASISAAEQLRQNLSYISISLKALWASIDWTGPYDKTKVTALGKLLTSSNKTVELLLKFKDDIQSSAVSEDDVYDRLMFSISFLPPEYFDQIKERWDTFVQS